MVTKTYLDSVSLLWSSSTLSTQLYIKPLCLAFVDDSGGCCCDVALAGPVDKVINSFSGLWHVTSSSVTFAGVTIAPFGCVMLNPRLPRALVPNTMSQSIP